ncbi:MAG: hypothetical protein ACFFCP_15505 [Promethearchaeota archaeon]
MYKEESKAKSSAAMDARIKRTSILPRSINNYINALGGIALSMALLIPIMYLPGLILLILPSEAYLIDWTFSHLKPTDEISYIDLSKERSGNYSRAELERTATSESIIPKYSK